MRNCSHSISKDIDISPQGTVILDASFAIPIQPWSASDMTVVLDAAHRAFIILPLLCCFFLILRKKVKRLVCTKLKEYIGVNWLHCERYNNILLLLRTMEITIMVSTIYVARCVSPLTERITSTSR